MRVRVVFSILAAAALLLGYGYPAAAQGLPGRAPRVTVPQSSVEHPQDIGRRMHTNVLTLGEGPFKPAEQASPSIGPPFPGYLYETPGSLACIYRLVPATPGCNPNTALTTPLKGARAIAVVDAFDNPNIIGDLAAFSAQFGLPIPTPSTFQVIYATGTMPPPDPTGGGWTIEAALDVEYAHAMAPNATLFLVEAASNSFGDLVFAELVAESLVAAAGGGDISNSWGGGEFPGENIFDPLFLSPNTVFFASTGDSPGTNWPSVSSNVVAVGGSTTNRNPFTGNFEVESAWEYGGGGPTLFEPAPSYQSAHLPPTFFPYGPNRSVPDMAADANPITGVWVLATSPPLFPGWYIVGGTSVSSPLMAGIINAAGKFHPSSADLLEHVYSKGQNVYGTGSPFGFNDIKVGYCGPSAGYFTRMGYDWCTGVGSPDGYLPY